MDSFEIKAHNMIKLFKAGNIDGFINMACSVQPEDRGYLCRMIIHINGKVRETWLMFGRIYSCPLPPGFDKEIFRSAYAVLNYKDKSTT